MGTETAKTRSRHPIRGALLAAFADVGVSTLPAPGALAVGRDCVATILNHTEFCGCFCRDCTDNIRCLDCEQ